MLQINQPYAQFTELDGSALENGYIYIGTAGQNPQTNPIAVYWDEAGMIDAAQPLRTSGGYIARNGSPARCYIMQSDYSMLIRSRDQSLISSELNAAGLADSLRDDLAAPTGATLVGFLQSGDDAVADTVEGKLQQQSKNLLDFMTDAQRTAHAAGTEADLTAKIETFKAAALTENTVLEWPPGTSGFDYTLEASPTFGIYFNQNALLQGAGMEHTVLKNRSATAAGLRCAAGFITARDFTLDNNGSTGEAFRQGGQYSKTENVVIKNQAGSSYAMIIDGSTNATIDSATLSDVSNGISFSATTPTNYVSLNAVAIEPSSGKAVNVGANSTSIHFNNLYIEPTNDAGNLEKSVYITDSQDVLFNGFAAELGGTHVLTDSAHFETNNSKTVSFKGGYVSHSGTASKIVFYMTGTANYGTHYSGMDMRSTKTGMTLFDNASTAAYGMSVRDIVTTMTSVANGVVHTALVTGFTLENWVDSSAACSHTINASQAFIRNVTGNIALTEQANQVLVNCTGTLSGTGAASAIRLACGDAIQAWIGNKNDSGTIRANNTHATFTDQNITSAVATAAGTGFNHHYCTSNGVGVFRVQGNGDVGNTNNSYGAISDIKYKCNYAPVESQWDDIKAIKLYKGNLKSDPDGHKQLYVIAQELEQSSPGLVYEFDEIVEKEVEVKYKAKGGRTKTRKEKTFVKSGEKSKGVKYSVMYLKAVAALQEAMERIELLEKLVAKLSEGA